MLNLHLLECTLKGYDHISDLLLAKYWVITGCKYFICSGLTSIVIGNGIKRLPTYVFGGCTSLSSIIIPANVETIETKAFKDCSALKEIHVKNPLPPTVYDAFSTYSHVVLYVPIGSKEAYQNHSIWGKFSTIIEE